MFRQRGAIQVKLTISIIMQLTIFQSKTFEPIKFLTCVFRNRSKRVFDWKKSFMMVSKCETTTFRNVMKHFNAFQVNFHSVETYWSNIKLIVMKHKHIDHNYFKENFQIITRISNPFKLNNLIFCKDLFVICYLNSTFNV